MDGKPVLPQGTLVEGHLETTPARRMMRRGALRMIFDRLKLPDGTVQPARFELSSTESNAAKTDREGTVHPTVSKKRLAIQLGATALVAKLADDLSEEALATTAGAARWYGLAASTTFLLLQKGREVKLKPGEVILVDLVRDGSALPMNPSGQAANSDAPCAPELDQCQAWVAVGGARFAYRRRYPRPCRTRS